MASSNVKGHRRGFGVGKAPESMEPRHSLIVIVSYPGF